MMRRRAPGYQGTRSLMGGVSGRSGRPGRRSPVMAPIGPTDASGPDRTGPGGEAPTARFELATHGLGNRKIGGMDDDGRNQAGSIRRSAARLRNRPERAGSRVLGQFLGQNRSTVSGPLLGSVRRYHSTSRHGGGMRGAVMGDDLAALAELGTAYGVPAQLDPVVDAIIGRTKITGGENERTSVLEVVALLVVEPGTVGALRSGEMIPAPVVQSMVERADRSGLRCHRRHWLTWFSPTCASHSDRLSRVVGRLSSPPHRTSSPMFPATASGG